MTREEERRHWAKQVAELQSDLEELEGLREYASDLESVVFNLLPDPYRAVVRRHAYRASEPPVTRRAWALVEEILALAKPTMEQREAQAWNYGATQIPCPLCGRISSAPYAEGFTWPEGLRRHLEGSHHANACAVTRVAYMAAHREASTKAPAVDSER